MENPSFFNTFSGKIEKFLPLEPPEVRMYACGPTVYDYAHIGNFRAFVFEDLLRRFLQFKGYTVNHVMNLTDVDDKTIAGAKREGKSLQAFTEKYIQAFNEDLAKLNCLPPVRQPRATEKIDLMIELIARLIEKEFAYVSSGSVYYRVAKFSGYGKLSKKKLEMNIAGASERVDSDEYESKETASDFVLWKAAKEGEPSWDSPWGKGRPGWHIECSAMSMKLLGETFDLHLGGEDLIFPHHENEIAQSEAATGKPFVRYWMHCKFLLVNGEKMSKSKGNFYTLRDLLAQGCDPMAIRYALLSTHYRTPLNFTLEGLKETSEVIKRLDECYWKCLSMVELLNEHRDLAPKKSDFENLPKLVAVMKEINSALEEDLNVSSALAALFEGVTEINSWFQGSAVNAQHALGAIYFFTLIDQLFGFDVTREKSIPGTAIQKLIALQDARKQKDFKTSDLLRDELKQDWIVKDGKPGYPSTLKKKQRIWDK